MLRVVEEESWSGEIVENAFRRKKRRIFLIRSFLLIFSMLSVGLCVLHWPSQEIIRHRGSEDFCTFRVSESMVVAGMFNVKLGCSFSNNAAVIVGDGDNVTHVFKMKVGQDKLIKQKFETDKLAIKVIVMTNDEWTELNALKVE